VVGRRGRARTADRADRPPGRRAPAARRPARRAAGRRGASYRVRPAGDRHTPVVLCDERARLLGLVTLERVLGRLADAVDCELVDQRYNAAP
jgi:hypothetical protein